MTAHISPRDVAERRTVAGLLPDRDQAEQAIAALQAAGFTGDQIGVALRDRTAQGVLLEETGTQVAEEAAATGALGGGLLGGLSGLLIGIGALAIPGLGPIMAAGALATTLGGAALGAAAGGLIGALVAMGIPEEEARGYEASVRGGSVLLTVAVSREEQVREARRIFARFGGGDVRVYEAGAGGSGQSATA